MLRSMRSKREMPQLSSGRDSSSAPSAVQPDSRFVRGFKSPIRFRQIEPYNTLVPPQKEKKRTRFESQNKENL